MRRILLQKIDNIDTRFIFTVKSDNVGTSGTDQFSIPTLATGNTLPYNYDIETSDGYTAFGITGDHTITFPSGAGTYTVYISGVFPRIRFGGSGDKDKILTVENWGIYGTGSTSQEQAFRKCFNVDFLALDSPYFSAVTEPNYMFQECTSSQSIVVADYSNCQNFIYAFFDNDDVVTFPVLDFSSATGFSNAFRFMISLVNFPPNMFDTCSATDFSNAFAGTNLSQTSIDNILVSIDTAGQSGGTFLQSGGSAPSSAGETAIDNLRARGWTVTVTGGY